MTDTFLSYKQSSIQYKRWGTGEELLVCFHGYGESAESFAAIAKQLQSCYTIIAINLPFHGDSSWNEGLLFSTEDLVAIVTGITTNRRFAVMGFSMGGRIALQLYQAIPSSIIQLFLLAPDGLKMNTWYWFATQNRLGNNLFRYFMKKPRVFFSITNLLKKAGRINAGVYNYVTQFLQQEKLRMNLYKIWTCFRNIKPNVPLVSKQINQYQTPVALIYGEHDTIIQYTTGRQFAKTCSEYCSLTILPCGHRLLQEKNLPAIVSIILDQKPTCKE